MLTVYLLSASIFTPIFGRLGDMFGKERMLFFVLGLFAVGSLIAALSSSLALLVAGRAVQGAAGAVFPLAFGIIRDEFPRDRVATGIGLISATFGIGGGAGPGPQRPDRRPPLVPLDLLVRARGGRDATIATRLWVPESPVKSPARVDYGGAALFSAGLTTFLVAVSEGNSWGWGSARDPRACSWRPQCCS